MLDERAFLELIESIKSDAESGVRMFPMAELNKLYRERRAEFGLDTSTTNTTRLKTRILEKFDGELQEQGTEHGPKTLIFSDGINDLIESAKQYQHYNNRMKTIMKAVKYLRDHNGFKFLGQFEPSSQKDSVPTSLKASQR